MGVGYKIEKIKTTIQTRTKTLHVYRCNCCGSNCIRVVYSFNDPRKLGDWILSILENKYDLNHLDAMKLYQYSIRNNIDIFIYVAIVISILILCRVMLSKFAKYFDEINTGIDVLIQNEDKQIELSAEMDVMEQKLNTLKRTLEKRAGCKAGRTKKNDVVMYLAHDIKTPLTSIIGYLSLLDEAPDMPVDQKAKYVHITLDKAYRLEQLIDEFLRLHGITYKR